MTTLPPPPRISHDMLAARVQTLPALPSLAAELLAGFEDEVDIGVLSRRIAADEALAARALRVANSPFYGLSGQIDSIQEAIVVLGFRAVRAMVIAASAVRALSALPTQARFNPTPFWRHSIGTAVAARHLARLARHNPDSAFTAGLLHDIGEVVLAATFPDAYALVLDRQQGGEALLWEIEGEVLGLTHTDAGAVLGRHWGLPARIVEATAFHHAPDAQPSDLVALVHVADALAHALELAGTAHLELAPPLSDSAWKTLGLPWSRLASALPHIESEFKETLGALLG